MGTLTGQLSYSSMEHIVTKVKGKSGQMIECVILPLESNYIEKTEKDGKVYLNQGITVYDIAPEKQKGGFTRDIKIYPGKEIAAKLKEAKQYTPFIGKLKDWTAPIAEVNTSEQFDASIVPEDDLQF